MLDFVAELMAVFSRCSHIWFYIVLGNWALGGLLATGQTTEGIIEGRVVDEVSSQPISSAELILISSKDGRELFAKTNSQGFFSFASLSPETYKLTVKASSYRPHEVRNIKMPVSGLTVQNISLRSLTDIWQNGISRSVFAGDQSVLPLYGPDVDLSRSTYVENRPPTTGQLAPSLSVDISSEELLSLPLASRDPYALVVLQPNVTNDVGTLRGLGVSANGQRPSSTEFLLDGFQNNNYLSTGVLGVIPPEAVQEYRLSINNFSAEFGGTSGYLANVITRASSNIWHGLAYADLTNQSWNAENPQDKLAGGPAPSQQDFAGGLIGGAVIKDRIFNTSSFEWDRSRNSAQAQSYTLPNSSFLGQIGDMSAVGKLIASYPSPLASGPASFGSVILRPTVSLNHIDVLERVDIDSKDQKRRSFGRLIVDRLSQPDFIWSPYPAFTSGLNRHYTGAALSTNWTPKPNRSYELRLGYTQDSIGWDRAHPEIPALLTQLPSGSSYLFGSPASYTFQDQGKTLELGANAAVTTGRHALRWGGSFLTRSSQVDLSTPASPIQYSFSSIPALLAGTPAQFALAVSRDALTGGALSLPQLGRGYRYWQASGYLQDSYRLTERLLLHIGVRYEYYSAPNNTASQQDSLIQLGAGQNLQQRIQNAGLALGRSPYSADVHDWAPRVGLAYAATKNASLVLRASYGIFYDRPFDNLWLNVALNDAVPASATLTPSNQLDVLANPAINLQILNKALTANEQAGLKLGCAPRVLTIAPAGSLVRSLSVNCTSIDQTFFQPKLRSPYVQSFFGGLQKVISRSASAEVEYAGSVAHELITTDILNRSNGTCTGILSGCRDNDQFGDLDYRANQGSSSHHALAASLSVSHSRFLWRLNYTWSHTIDNQSEPLAGFAANLAQTNLSGNMLTPRQAAFTLPYDSSVDRGNSDFDIRHELSSYFSWSLPSPHSSTALNRVLRNWQAAGMATVRSGAPFTVYAYYDSSCGLFNNRSNLINPAIARTNTPYTGGEIILNAAAFQEPQCGTLGTSGRNAFYGPAAYTLDLSFARTFVPRSERWRVTARVDAFNVLNHANLNNPAVGNDACCAGSSTFGLATYGRSETNSGLPVTTPLSETARQLHFIVRLAF